MRLRRVDLEPLTPYPGAVAAAWSVRCLRCANEYTASVKAVARGVRGCRVCAAASRAELRRVSPEVAQAVMRRSGLQPLVPYPGHNKQPWPCMCLTCNSLVQPRYNSVQQGQGGCAPCGRRSRASGQRLPEDVVLADLERAGVTLLGDYRGVEQPLQCRCLNCNRLVSPTLHNIRSGQGACGYCSGTRVDELLAAGQMRAAGVDPIQPFPGSDAGWSCTCRTCGRYVTPRYSSIKQGQSGCKYCAGRAVDLDSALALMRAADVEPTGSWPGAWQPWEGRCLRCERTVRPAYNNIRRGYGGCAYCAGKAVDAVVAIDLMRAAGLEPLVPYPGSNVPWTCRCTKCTAVVTPRYSGITRGQGGCRSCARYGFDPVAPAVVYLLMHVHYAAVKVGVTGRDSARLPIHERHGWTLVQQWPTQEGATALRIERQVLRWWRGDLGAPTAVPSDLMPQGGASETAPIDLVDLTATADMIQELVAVTS